MANSSITGGYLTPAGSPAPLEDTDLDALFQQAVAGITGLPGSMVRPRWQQVSPKQPEPSADWCAIGVMVQTGDAGPAIIHDPSANGEDRYQRHEDIEVLASFYGLHGQAYAATFRDGIAIPQNVEGLNASGVSYVETGPIRGVPELVNQQWVRRYDLIARFRRMVSRTYAVQNVLLADVHLVDDTHVDELIHVPPAP